MKPINSAAIAAVALPAQAGGMKDSKRDCSGKKP